MQFCTSVTPVSSPSNCVNSTYSLDERIELQDDPFHAFQEIEEGQVQTRQQSLVLAAELFVDVSLDFFDVEPHDWPETSLPSILNIASPGSVK